MTVADPVDTQQDIVSKTTGETTVQGMCNSESIESAYEVSVENDENIGRKETEDGESEIEKTVTEDSGKADDTIDANNTKTVDDSTDDLEKSSETVGSPEHVLPSEMTGSAYDQYLQAQDPTDPAVSNLDLEMARLDSYLGETSDTSGTEYERSTSVSSSYKSGLSVEMGQGHLQSSSDYKTQESRDSSRTANLESQLEQLDLAAMSSLDQPDQAFQEQPKSLSSMSSMHSLEKSPSLDFYSKYASKAVGETSPGYEDPLQAEVDAQEEATLAIDDELSGLNVPDRSHFLKTVNNWTEVATFGNIHSLSVSSWHVWITDKSCNIYYSVLAGPSLNWKKASGTASQISVSLCGNILWCLHKNTVSAGTKITQKRPEGMKWVEAVRDVAYICVDQTCAW